MVQPGERIPVDAMVIGGGSHVDESMLTGESLPASRQPGQPVNAGSMNLDGMLLLETTAVGHDTMLAAALHRQAGRLPGGALHVAGSPRPIAAPVSAKHREAC